jgi:asparagine synthase (glutamine-hydrolysing)
LSGGFDSTSLALIAAKSLATRVQKLHTITVNTVSATESEDVKWAQHAAGLYPNIVSMMIEGNELPAEYSNLKSIPLTDAPDPVFIDIAEISYLMKTIRSKGSQLHMSGEGGDAVLSASYSYLADLLRRGRIGIFLQHTFGWSRVKCLSPVALMSGAVKLSLTSYRQGLLQLARELMTGQLSYQPFRSQPLISQIMGWEFLPEIVSWYTKNLVDLVVAELQRWATVVTPFTDSIGQHESIAVLQVNAFSARVEQQLAETFDVNLEFPYLDSLVIDACLCAKPEERTTPFVYKPLLSRALHRDLPSSVFTRTTKGDYTSDDSLGFRQNMTGLNELFQTSLLADMGLIDIGKFRAAIKQLGMGLERASWHLDQTLAIELWLRRVVDARNNFWM